MLVGMWGNGLEMLVVVFLALVVLHTTGAGDPPSPVDLVEDLPETACLYVGVLAPRLSSTCLALSAELVVGEGD